MARRTTVARVATADLSTWQVVLFTLLGALVTFVVLSIALALQAL